MQIKAKTYCPQVSVTLQTYKGKTLDLTPAVRSITINQGLDGPSASWSLTLSPLRDERGFSWYHLISPMDYVDIRFARFPESRADGELPPILRGFVDVVNITGSAMNHGIPERSYTIHGRDFGKLLEITLIYYNILDGRLVLPNTPRFTEKYGLDLKFSSERPGEVLKAIFDQIVLKQYDALKKGFKSLAPFNTLMTSEVMGRVHLFSALQYEGAVWGLLSYFDNSPWNELFVREMKEGPTLVFRRTPWKTPEGEIIQGDDETYEKLGGIKTPIDITRDDIISYDLSHSDDEVRNYYFVYPVASTLFDTSFKASAMKNDFKQVGNEYVGNPYIIASDDENAGLDRFGYRPCDYRVEYFDDYYRSEALGKEAHATCRTLNENLVRATRYNSLYEMGALTLRGNERIKPGVYIRFGDAEYYVVNVRHDLNFIAGSEYFHTTAQVTRGTGFFKARQLVRNADLQACGRH